MKKAILFPLAVATLTFSAFTAVHATSIDAREGGPRTLKGVEYTVDLDGSANGFANGDFEVWGNRTNNTPQTKGTFTAAFDQIVKWTLTQPLNGGRTNSSTDDPIKITITNGALLGWTDGAAWISDPVQSGNMITFNFTTPAPSPQNSDWSVFGTGDSVVVTIGSGNSGDWAKFNLQIPESGSTLAMLGLVMAGLAGVRRRRA